MKAIGVFYSMDGHVKPNILMMINLINLLLIIVFSICVLLDR